MSVQLRRLEAVLRSWLNRPHPKPGLMPAQALVGHIHAWDICRDYGQYKYRICLNGCNQRLPC